MDDFEAIKQLKARYFRTLDTKDWESMREVFADDFVMDTTASGGGVISGATEFMAFLRDALQDVVTVHHGHTPEIELTSSGDPRRFGGRGGVTMLRAASSRRNRPLARWATIRVRRAAST